MPFSMSCIISSPIPHTAYAKLQLKRCTADHRASSSLIVSQPSKLCIKIILVSFYQFYIATNTRNHTHGFTRRQSSMASVFDGLPTMKCAAFTSTTHLISPAVRQAPLCIKQYCVRKLPWRTYVRLRWRRPRLPGAPLPRALFPIPHSQLSNVASRTHFANYVHRPISYAVLPKTP